MTNDFGSGDRVRGSIVLIGSRIQMTKLGATRNPYLAEKEGTIVGRSRLNCSLRVLFDGRKTPISLHRNYIEPSTFKRE